MIFKGVRDGKPYPDHGLSLRDWSRIPPRQVRLDEIVTTTKVLELDRLLSEDSTFYGDLFPHAVQWQGVLYLEDGLHRAVRSALRNRPVLHARVFDYDALAPSPDALPEPLTHEALTHEAPPHTDLAYPDDAHTDDTHTDPAPQDFTPARFTTGRHRSDGTGPV